MGFGQLALVVAAGLAGPLCAASRRAFVPVMVGELVAGVILGHSGLDLIHSNVFILAHGIGHAHRAALDAVVGIAAASAIRVALTAAGLATLLASSAIAFRIMRWLGVHLRRAHWRIGLAGVHDGVAVLARCSPSATGRVPAAS